MTRYPRLNSTRLLLGLCGSTLLLALAAPVGAWACSKHGTNAGNEISVDYGGHADGDGLLLFTIGIEDEIVEPVAATTCVTALGLGSTGRSLPGNVDVISARVDRVDRASGEERPVEYFRFAADAETSAGMAAGGGSTPDVPRPIIDGATWFGFSSSVEPFSLETGPGEYIRMTFEVLVPEALAPLMTDVQFASGEGLADGTPVFEGEHPVQYYTVDEPQAELRKFRINAGLNDAWYNPDTSGQGFFLAVLPEAGLLFLSWFTYELERPAADVEAQLGEPGHRWLTAQGGFADDRAVLEIDMASGGVFDSPLPLVEHDPKGTIIAEFTNCNAGTIFYDIPSVGRQGMIAIQRIVEDNVLLCEALDSTAQVATE